MWISVFSFSERALPCPLQRIVWVVLSCLRVEAFSLTRWSGACRAGGRWAWGLFLAWWCGFVVWVFWGLLLNDFPCVLNLSRRLSFTRSPHSARDDFLGSPSCVARLLNPQGLLPCLPLFCPRDPHHFPPSSANLCPDGHLRLSKSRASWAVHSVGRPSRSRSHESPGLGASYLSFCYSSSVPSLHGLRAFSFRQNGRSSRRPRHTSFSSPGPPVLILPLICDSLRTHSLQFSITRQFPLGLPSDGTLSESVGWNSCLRHSLTLRLMSRNLPLPP